MRFRQNDKIHRRNSSLSIVVRENHQVVRKSYHSKFTIAQEANAYRDLEIIVKAIQGVRTAQLLRTTSRYLETEYIDGPTLHDEIANNGAEILNEHRGTLISLFWKAACSRMQFDFDPSNILVDQTSNDLIIIDPVCEYTSITNHGIVVFLIGLMKLAARTGRLWLRPNFFEAWYRYYKDYLTTHHLDFHVLNQELCAYITVVIHWNQAIDPTEGRSLRLRRKYVYIPAFYFIQAAFKYNIIRI